MACPACGCKVHYQRCSGNVYDDADDDTQRCAACGEEFYLDDSTPEDDEEDTQ